MPPKRLTAAAVERIKPPSTGRVEYFDAMLPAFGLRVTERGHKSWIVGLKTMRNHQADSFESNPSAMSTRVGFGFHCHQLVLA